MLKIDLHDPDRLVRDRETTRRKVIPHAVRNTLDDLAFSGMHRSPPAGARSNAGPETSLPYVAATLIIYPLRSASERWSRTARSWVVPAGSDGQPRRAAEFQHTILPLALADSSG